MVKKLQWIWNRIPKTICRNLLNSFDEKIGLFSKDGERVNKRKHKSIKYNYSWKNNWNNNDNIERIMYNNKILEFMQNKKIKNLKKELNNIHIFLVEVKKRFSGKNKKKSRELCNFFLVEVKKMLETFELRKKEKEEEIQKWNNLKGKGLFEAFNINDKFYNINLNSGKLNLGLTNLATELAKCVNV